MIMQVGPDASIILFTLLNLMVSVSDIQGGSQNWLRNSGLLEKAPDTSQRDEEKWTLGRSTFPLFLELFRSVWWLGLQKHLSLFGDYDSLEQNKGPPCALVHTFVQSILSLWKGFQRKSFLENFFRTSYCASIIWKLITIYSELFCESPL